MPTIKELMEAVVAKEEVVPQEIEHKKNDAIKKMNKVKRLKKLCEGGGKVGFIAYTPGTESGRMFHCVNMMQAKVEKTLEGNFVIVGFDVELTLTKMAENGVDVSKRVMFSNIKPEYKVYRSYRIDRILDGTITFE